MTTKNPNACSMVVLLHWLLHTTLMGVARGHMPLMDINAANVRGSVGSFRGAVASTNAVSSANVGGEEFFEQTRKKGTRSLKDGKKKKKMMMMMMMMKGDKEPEEPEEPEEPQAPVERCQLIEGIHLPIGQPLPDAYVEMLKNFDPTANVEQDRQLVYDLGVIGQPKSDPHSLDPLRFLVAVTANWTVPPPTPDYQLFGREENRVQEFIELFKTNPFFVSALTMTDDEQGFELKSYDPDEEDPSLYLQMIRILNGIGHRVNFLFDSDLQIQSLTYYDDIEGKAVVQGSSTETDEAVIHKYATAALYNLMFYASVVHGVIHLFMYLVVSGFDIASEDYPELNVWAKTYATETVYLTYCLSKGTLAPAPPPPNADSAFLSGSEGFGSTPEIIPIFVDLLNNWGTNPTVQGFYDSLFNVPRDKMDQAGILTEFNRHADLIVPFANEASLAFQEINPDKFKDFERKLKDYTQNCGSFESEISSLDEYLQIISVLGNLHGGTLSFSRLFGAPSVMKWRNIQQEEWTFDDINLMFTLILAVTGLSPGHYVMTSTEADYAPEFEQIIETYDGMVTQLKSQYQAEISQDPSFSTLGFIQTDYCPDLFDGKQLTLATYV